MFTETRIFPLGLEINLTRVFKTSLAELHAPFNKRIIEHMPYASVLCVYKLCYHRHRTQCAEGELKKLEVPENRPFQAMRFNFREFWPA